MLRDFCLELVNSPGSGATITLPGVAPSGRLTWAASFVTSQPYVFYVLDDSTQQEWGVGTLTVGSPSTITRPTVVLGNSLGTTSRVAFTDTCRCYSGTPSSVTLATMAGGLPRNLLHNATDRVQQRGAGPWTLAGYISDRWLVSTGTAGGTRSVTIANLVDADRSTIGDEEAAYATQYVFSGGSGAGDFDLLSQRVESVRRTAGKFVTVSFWARAASGTPKIGVALRQNFGSGGSPSATTLVSAQTVTLSTTLTRYALVFVVPSVSGKALGSNVGTDYLQLDFWLSSGATNNTQAGSIGVQAATVTMYGRLLEIGASVTPLERQEIGFDTANCQRFYQVGRFFSAAYQVNGADIQNSAFLPVVMRGSPTVNTVLDLSSGFSLNSYQGAANFVAVTGASTATGTYYIDIQWNATADL